MINIYMVGRPWWWQWRVPGRSAVSNLHSNSINFFWVVFFSCVFSCCFIAILETISWVPWMWKVMVPWKASSRRFSKGLGEDTSWEGLRKTPSCMAKAFHEATWGCMLTSSNVLIFFLFFLLKKNYQYGTVLSCS